MKQKKLFGLAIALLFGLSPLFAQKQMPPLMLKPGDWFEADVQINNTEQMFDHQFNLRYEVSSKTADGNLVFNLIFERMRLKYKQPKNISLGYDSYYPPYTENRKKKLDKQRYELITDRRGHSSKIKLLQPAEKVKLSLISANTSFSVPITAIEYYSIFPNAQLNKISESIISSLISGKDLAQTLVLLNPTGGRTIANAVLKSASFKVPDNALIKGNISNLTAADSIYSITSTAVWDKEQILRFNKDGSFSASILTDFNSRPRWLFGQFDEFKTFSSFLAPLDTLIVKADALNFDKTVSFGGNAAAKASLSRDLVAVFDKQWVNESNYRTKSIPELIAFQQQGKKDFDRILNKYEQQVPAAVVNFFRTNFKYVQAGTRLMYATEYRKKQSQHSYFDEFPKGFFLPIDTLPVSMSVAEGNIYYGYFLTWLLPYQQTKLRMVNAKPYGFYADFATAMASFEGYPLYFSVRNSLEKELHKSDLQNTERLKNYYEDFIINCGDTVATNRLKKLWEKARLWLPGNPSPVQQLLLKDRSKLDLSQFKGKPLVLIINNNTPNILKGYLDLIKKQQGSQVHFVIAQRNTADWGIDQELKGLANVTYVELSNDDKQKNLALYNLQTKVFTFNSDFRVISGYLINQYPGEVRTDPTEIRQVLQHMIKEAIDSSVMTKAQKASLINTLGWSIGSALLTLVIVFSIYRLRLANIKKKNLIKNKIKELEIKAIRSQMNPHFMFNALNSIQSLINNNQYEEANIYLEKFSLLMRQVLNHSAKNFVTLSDELEAIKLYCELEQLRFNFQFEIEIAPEVNIQLMEIPGMIIQPLIENAVLHGLAQKADAGLLQIRISCDQHCLRIVIKDNGTGLKEKSINDRKSFGLKLVKERLALLNTGQNVGELHLSSNLGECGVNAVLTIPID